MACDCAINHTNYYAEVVEDKVEEKKVEEPDWNKVHPNYSSNEDMSAEKVLGTPEEEKAHKEYEEKKPKPKKRKYSRKKRGK